MTKNIQDTDPGHDDAIALLLAMASPELDVLGVTTVSGNQTLEKTTANALKILEFVDRTDVPVHVGAPRPLVREQWAAAYVHGESGLDGPDLPIRRRKRGTATRSTSSPRKSRSTTASSSYPSGP